MIDREMAMEFQFKLSQTNLTQDELDNVTEIIDCITEGEWDELNKRISDRQINDLDRLKNGEYVNMGQIDAAVIRAAKSDKT